MAKIFRPGQSEKPHLSSSFKDRMKSVHAFKTLKMFILAIVVVSVHDKTLKMFILAIVVVSSP